MGRGTASIVETGRLAALAVIEFADIPAVHEYEVDRSLFQARFPHASDIDEIIVRVALTRVHREAGAAPAAQADKRLSPELPPWIGDFAASLDRSQPCAAGGAESRAANAEMEAIVETGVELQRVAGRRAAASAMQSANVPLAVIRRVLSNSTSRRHTTSEENSANEGNGS